MAFEGLSERLQGAMTKIGKKGKITEADLKEMMREVRLALLEADVNFKVVKEFVKKVNERALGSDVLESLSPTQQVIKIVNEELTELMGGQQEPFQFSAKPPTVVMMVGLQGAGKTTTAGKLANYMKKKENKRPMLVAADVYRPAAINQLQTLGKQLDFPVYALGTEANPVDKGIADFYPIFEVSKTELAAGWDGANPGEVHDRNRWIAGTKSALVYFNGSEMIEYLELGGTMKLDYAIVGPRRSFSVLNYGTPVEYMPGKIARIINIGKIGLPTT